jgi:hypothetical protein
MTATYIRRNAVAARCKGRAVGLRQGPAGRAEETSVRAAHLMGLIGREFRVARSRCALRIHVMSRVCTGRVKRTGVGGNCRARRITLSLPNVQAQLSLLQSNYSCLMLIPSDLHCQQRLAST